EVLNWKAMVRWGMINEEEYKMLQFADTVDEAFDRIRAGLEKYHMEGDQFLQVYEADHKQILNDVVSNGCKVSCDIPCHGVFYESDVTPSQPGPNMEEWREYEPSNGREKDFRKVHISGSCACWHAGVRWNTPGIRRGLRSLSAPHRQGGPQTPRSRGAPRLEQQASG